MPHPCENKRRRKRNRNNPSEEVSTDGGFGEDIDDVVHESKYLVCQYKWWIAAVLIVFVLWYLYKHGTESSGPSSDPVAAIPSSAPSGTLQPRLGDVLNEGSPGDPAGEIRRLFNIR